MNADTLSTGDRTAPAEFAGAAGPLRPKTLAERRTGAIRFGGLFGAIVTGFYFFYNMIRALAFDLPFNFTEMTIEVVFFGLFAAATLAARRHRRAMSYALPITVCAISVLMSCLFGWLGGTHVFILTLGPITAMIFAARRPYACLTWSTVAVFLHLAIHFLVPQIVDGSRPLIEQIADPSSLTFRQHDINYIINIVAVEFGLTLCTYFAMHWATIAEVAMTREYARSELLLQNLLPASIATRLKDDPGGIIADQFDFISILFADVVNFTPASAAKKPEEIVNFLGQLFGEFDVLAEKHGLEKIKTIGDAYMVAGGMPEKSEGHPDAMANMALDMIAVSEALMADFDEQLSIRIGLHVGPATAGVIGHNKPYYDVWGDTINIAARMEAFGVPGRIQITPEVRDILGARYRFENRGLVDIKGKGLMDLYFLTGRSPEAQ